MAKKAENTDTKRTENAEAAAEAVTKETVEIDADELKAMKAQLALLTQKLANEERQRGVKDMEVEKEEEAARNAQARYEKSMELVDYYIDKGSIMSNKNVEVSINGYQYVVPKGEHVKIPRCVAEAIDNSIEQRELAYGLQEKRNAEFLEADEKGYFTV